MRVWVSLFIALCFAMSVPFAAGVACAAETPAQRTSAPANEMSETSTTVDVAPAEPEMLVDKAAVENAIVDEARIDDASADGRVVALDAVQEIGPPEPLRANEIYPADAPPGRLVIYRAQSKPAWRAPKVSVNGGPTFRLAANRAIEFALPPGLHRVRVDWAADTLRPDLLVDIRIAPGRIDYVRLSGTYTAVGPNQFRLGSYAEWIAPDIAVAELSACCRRGRAL